MCTGCHWKQGCSTSYGLVRGHTNERTFHTVAIYRISANPQSTLVPKSTQEDVLVSSPTTITEDVVKPKVGFA